VLEPRCADPRDREIVAAMVKRIDDLNNKVEDLLLYARPRAPRLQPVNVGTLVRELAHSARAATGSLGPPIAVAGGDDVSALADVDMLRAALLNVMMNACQAAGPSAVDVTVSAEAGTCRIAVADCGPGIPAGMRELIFEPFFTTRAEGTGLGLAIVKRSIERLNGTIGLSDRPGGGTVAEIAVPLAPSGMPR
jgi:signal transduction histidine kinase